MIALPALRGRIQRDAPLAPQTWFRVGGAAEVLFRPADVADLAELLAALPPEVPVTPIGVASNLLVRDGGVRGVVVRLARGFAEVERDGDLLRCGAGALDATVAELAAAAGLAGLEFLAGIPGTIGGAVRMNAGAYGGELADILVEAQVVGRDGRVEVWPARRLGLAYRHSDLPPGALVVGAVLRGRPDDPAAIRERMAEIRRRRQETQPVRARTGGSTFANPPGDKAWRLIDAAGCRGLARGAAEVSDLHCNFLVNRGGASAADLEGLGEEVRARVEAMSGVRLAWEIQRIGESQP